MADNVSTMTLDQLLAALETKREELQANPALAARAKAIGKGITTPREKSYQVLRALLGNATKEIRTAVASAVTSNAAIAVKFLVDKWGDALDIEIEVSSIAGEAPAGKHFQSVGSSKFYPSRHAFLRTEVKDHMRSSYAKGQVGDNVLKLVEVTPPAPAKK
jgi:hypothetical protein